MSSAWDDAGLARGARTICVGNGLGLEADEDVVELTDAHENVAAHYQLVAHLNPLAGAHLQCSPSNIKKCLP